MLESSVEKVDWSGPWSVCLLVPCFYSIWFSLLKKSPNCIIWQFKNILKFEFFKNHHLSFHIHFLPIGPVCVLSHICDPMNYIAFQAPLSMESSTEGYWSGLSFTTPGDLPNPGVKPMSFPFPALAGRFFTTVPPGKPLIGRMTVQNNNSTNSNYLSK